MKTTPEKQGSKGAAPKPSTKVPLTPCDFSKRVFIVVLAVVALWLLFKAQQVILLTFAGLVVAVVLGGAAGKLATHLPWPRPEKRYTTSVWIVSISALSILAAGLYFVGPKVSKDIKKLEKEIPAAIEQVKDLSPIEVMLEANGSGTLLGQSSTMLESLPSAAKSLASGTVFVLTGIIYIIFVGLFGAAQPGLYRKSATSFFPRHLREESDRIFRCTIRALKDWLKGQGLAMLIIGLFSGVGLFLIDVRYALTLAILAGLFQFVPYIGPIVSAVPAILVAFTMSPQTALWVTLLYLGIQFVEGNFITPMVMQHEADLPPLATLLATIAFAAVFGLLGAIVATPLAVVLMTLKQEVYEKRILEAYDHNNEIKQHV